ncbi:hypothetical protein Ancab_031442 [Ancistrocladus abbreviatus]
MASPLQISSSVKLQHLCLVWSVYSQVAFAQLTSDFYAETCLDALSAINLEWMLQFLRQPARELPGFVSTFMFALLMVLMDQFCQKVQQISSVRRKENKAKILRGGSM